MVHLQLGGSPLACGAAASGSLGMMQPGLTDGLGNTGSTQIASVDSLGAVREGIRNELVQFTDRASEKTREISKRQLGMKT